MHYMPPNGRFHNKQKFIESGGYYDKEFLEDEDQVYINRIALLGQKSFTYTAMGLQLKTDEVDTQSLPILLTRFALIDSKAYLTFIKDRATALDLIRQQLGHITRCLQGRNCHYLALYVEMFYLHLKYQGMVDSSAIKDFEDSKVFKILS